MRSLRAFQTVCSNWATAWPTTRRAWTTRRTSRPCAHTGRISTAARSQLLRIARKGRKICGIN
ncbi:hypothetical protein LEMLEM_LOCUS8309 [Lemmus lemmus]